ncbi:hypothetical protein A33K_16287 [Burkholderia humptydooensis MSMB43]|uniref:Uncharacterized protein n=1 Tax=Burkholderia humptydooensis MSMB43 TaxID=441157 RepID=A0ABN0G339_9BURK|nr:hypothetical protein A33K_16287 [Burkholderia humptydooensis MSMB43]
MEVCILFRKIPVAINSAKHQLFYFKVDVLFDDQPAQQMTSANEKIETGDLVKKLQSVESTRLC